MGWSFNWERLWFFKSYIWSTNLSFVLHDFFLIDLGLSRRKVLFWLIPQHHLKGSTVPSLWKHSLFLSSLPPHSPFLFSTMATHSCFFLPAPSPLINHWRLTCLGFVFEYLGFLLYVLSVSVRSFHFNHHLHWECIFNIAAVSPPTTAPRAERKGEGKWAKSGACVVKGKTLPGAPRRVTSMSHWSTRSHVVNPKCGVWEGVCSSLGTLSLCIKLESCCQWRGWINTG